MPHYHRLGNIPHKRHTQYRKPDGSLYSEQLFSTEGFSSDYSLLYHLYPPTQVRSTDPPVDMTPELAPEELLRHRSFQGFQVEPERDYLISRRPLLVNNDCQISLSACRESMTD